MNANRQFDEDDLVLYAMRLLAEPEHAEVAAFVAATPEAQARLTRIQTTLAAYAEVSVEPQSLPAGSLDRLLSRIEHEPQGLATSQARAASPLEASALPLGQALTGSSVPESAADSTTQAARPADPLPAPVLVPRAAAKSASGSAAKSASGSAATPASSALHQPSFGWAAALGWALAALLAIAAGVTLQQRSSLRGVLNSRETQITALTSDSDNLRRERDALRASISTQEERLANSSSELAATQSQANALKHEASNARSTAQNLSGQTAQLSARLNEEQARRAAAEQEKNRLQGTLAAQADQLASLEAATSNAEVLATLTDPSALRVVLTKPKSKPAPVGRAAYVASKGSLVFLANNLQPLEPNKVYELWILPADGTAPVPAGTFVPDAKGDAHVLYARFPRAVPAKGFAMTIENAGGATTPTLPLILAGS